MSKQDGCATRTPADLERKYSFGQTFSEQRSLISKAQRAANEAMSSLERLDQKQLVQLLTDYGNDAGLYLDGDGNLCFNASFIRDGMLGDSYLPATIARVNQIPENVSQLDNDEGYLNETALDPILLGWKMSWDNLPDDVAKTSAIPATTSDLTNDSGFITGSEATNLANDAISASAVISGLSAKVTALETAVADLTARLEAIENASSE